MSGFESQLGLHSGESEDCKKKKKGERERKKTDKKRILKLKVVPLKILIKSTRLSLN